MGQDRNGWFSSSLDRLRFETSHYPRRMRPGLGVSSTNNFLSVIRWETLANVLLPRSTELLESRRQGPFQLSMAVIPCGSLRVRTSRCRAMKIDWDDNHLLSNFELTPFQEVVFLVLTVKSMVFSPAFGTPMCFISQVSFVVWDLEVDSQPMQKNIWSLFCQSRYFK